MSGRKLGIHSKHNTVTLFQKTHTKHDALSSAASLALLATPRNFACNCRTLLSLRCWTPLLPPLILYIPKKSGLARKPAGQPACEAGHENQPAFCMRGGPKRDVPTRFVTPTQKLH